MRSLESEAGIPVVLEARRRNPPFLDMAALAGNLASIVCELPPVGARMARGTGRIESAKRQALALTLPARVTFAASEDLVTADEDEAGRRMFERHLSPGLDDMAADTGRWCRRLRAVTSVRVLVAIEAGRREEP